MSNKHYSKAKTARELLLALTNLSEEDLDKRVIIYDNRGGFYCDYIDDVGLEPSEGVDIVIGYGTPPKEE